MKKLLTTLPILLGFAALAEYDYIRLPPDGTPVTVELGGRLVAAQAFESVDIQRLDSNRSLFTDIEEESTTNTTYCLSYTNAVGNVVTNTTDYDLAPLPAGYQYISYWTNTVVTTTATTNSYWAVSGVITNTLCTTSTEVLTNLFAALLTQEEIGYLEPLFLPPGTQLRASGSDPGGPAPVLILER